VVNKMVFLLLFIGLIIFNIADEIEGYIIEKI